MRALLLLAVALTSVTTVTSQEIRRAVPVDNNTLIRCEINPNLPFDCVEIATDRAIPVDGFYMQKPTHRPADVPSTFVIVEVVRIDRDTHHLKLLGWIFMDADLVNELHEIMPPEQAIATL